MLKVSQFKIFWLLPGTFWIMTNSWRKQKMLLFVCCQRSTLSKVKVQFTRKSLVIKWFDVLSSHENLCRDYERPSERHVSYHCDDIKLFKHLQGSQRTSLQQGNGLDSSGTQKTNLVRYLPLSWSSVIRARTWNSLNTKHYRTKRTSLGFLVFVTWETGGQCWCWCLPAEWIQDRCFYPCTFASDHVRKYTGFCLKSYSVWAPQCHKLFNIKICWWCLSELLPAEKTFAYFLHIWLLFSHLAYEMLL